MALRICFTGALIYLLSFACYAKEWKLSADELNIKVYSRQLPDTPLDEIKAESIVQADIAKLAKIMGDIENFNDWMFACLESKIINRKNGVDFKLYYVHETPWPYKNRDVILQIRATDEFTNGKFQVEMNSIDSNYSANKNLVRMSAMRGSWIFQKVSDSQTRVIFKLFVNPSGNVPFPFVNSGNVKIVLETFKGLKRIANNKAYVKATEEEEVKELERALQDSGIM